MKTLEDDGGTTKLSTINARVTFIEWYVYFGSNIYSLSEESLEVLINSICYTVYILQRSHCPFLSRFVGKHGVSFSYLVARDKRMCITYHA